MTHWRDVPLKDRTGPLPDRTRPSICVTEGLHKWTWEDYRACMDQGHSWSPMGLPKQAPTPPLPPSPDHAPSPPSLDRVERNVNVDCPRCGYPVFGARYEDGSLWTYGHSSPAVVGACPALPVQEQATLEGFA